MYINIRESVYWALGGGMIINVQLPALLLAGGTGGTSLLETGILFGPPSLKREIMSTSSTGN